MEAFLKFNLPDDQDSFTLATKGSNYWNCLWDLDEWLRNELKHNDDYWAGYKGDLALEKVRQRFFEILDDRNCSLDDVS